MTAPLRSQTPIEDALAHIQAEPTVWIRLAAVRNDNGELHASLLELTSGAAPPGWEPSDWEYPAVRFSAFQLSGSDIAERLREGMVNLAGTEICLLGLQQSVRWDRQQSGHEGAHQPLEWPTTEVELAQPTGSQSDPQGPLLPTHEAPSFLTFYTAAASFFWLGGQVVGGAINQGIVYRHQDIRARIRYVRISNDSIEVEIDGHGSDDMILELPADSPGPSKRIWLDSIKPVQTVTFELEDRLPPGTWVLLRKGSEWIDRRFLTLPWARGTQAGVEHVVDGKTRLEALVASRERNQVEFKRQIPKDSESRARLMKTVCAFANGAGGSVLVGVDDDRSIIGVGPDEFARMSDQLTQMVGSWVEPRPNVEFLELPIEDSVKLVMEMWVQPVAGDICGSGSPGETKTAYVRHHGVTEKATLPEIKSIVQARTSSSPGFSFNAYT